MATSTAIRGDGHERYDGRNGLGEEPKVLRHWWDSLQCRNKSRPSRRPSLTRRVCECRANTTPCVACVFHFFSLFFSLSLSLFRRPLGVFFPLLFFSRLAAVLADSLVVARIPRFQSRRQFDRCRKERFFFEAKRSNQTVEEQCNDPILNLFFLFRLWRNAEGRQRWGPPKE